MANQEYRPHLPVQFLATNLHVAECQRMSTLQIHPQSLCPESRLPLMSTKLSPSLASSVRLSLSSTSPNALLTHSSASLTTTSKSGTNCKLGTALLPGTLS